MMGRIMQGSAETVAESLLYEAAGTIAELAVADAFLKSRTPFLNQEIVMRSCLSKTKVSPAKGPDDHQRSRINEREACRRTFCEMSMVMISITEAAGLLNSSIFWLLMSANPNEPGSPPVPVRQTLINLAIMLFGELIVTDGAIAYVSHTFRDRYVLNLAASWEQIRSKQQRLLWVLVALTSMVATFVLIDFPQYLCFTSPIEDESTWALTSCPEIPRNISDVGRVSMQYQEHWEKYN